MTVYKLCRLGTMLWKLPTPDAEMPSEIFKSGRIDQLSRSVCKALDNDSRVARVLTPELSVAYSYRLRFYPDQARTNDESLLSGSDGFEALSLSDPIRLKLTIPRKNQPPHRGYSDFPADTYHVAWDGITAFVLWRQNTDNAPMAGGQVITGTLTDALATVNAELYVQACNPACDNLFFHTNLHVHGMAGEDDETQDRVVQRPNSNDVDVFVPDETDDFETLDWLYIDFNNAAENFAEVKNLARRLLDMEYAARGSLSHLLSHIYEHARATSKPPNWPGIKARWEVKGWRREANQLLSGLWLSLANIEMLRRDWDDKRREFETSSTDSSPIFTVDFSGDSASVESFHPGHLDAIADQIGGSFANRALVMATAGGALAGGLAGALAAGLLH